jgi:glycosyltransferase involved in cell wall biosynthesis
MAALQNGHEVIISVVGWENKPARITDLEKAGAVLLFRPRERKGTGLFSRMSRYFSHMYRNPFEKIFKHSPDRILVSQGGTFDLVNEPFLFTSLLRKNIPWYLVAEFNYDFGVLLPFQLKAARSFFPAAQKVFFVCDRNLRTTERQVALKLSRAEIIRNPVNLTSTTYVDWPGQSEIMQLGCVARLDCRHKGQDTLFETLSSGKWKERSWQLNLYGDGDDENYLKLLAIHFGIGDKVVFHGHATDIRNVWSKNHAMILPSVGEGVPLALVEAMICGRMAVVADVGGHSEWIHNDDTGFLAESPSSLHMDKALEQAWQTRDQWEQMGKRARVSAMEKMDSQPGKTLLQKITA